MANIVGEILFDEDLVPFDHLGLDFDGYGLSQARSWPRDRRLPHNFFWKAAMVVMLTWLW